MKKEKPGDFLAQLGNELKSLGFRVGISGYDQVFIDEAKRSVARSMQAFRRKNFHLEAGAAASAILCAAASCEARLSEYLAHWEFASGELPKELAELRNMWDARRQWNKLLRYRAPTYDLGASKEFRALGCLFLLRDHIAHRHARLMHLDTWPTKLEDCVRQGSIPVRSIQDTDWTAGVFVYEVAAWAFETAKAWFIIVDKLVPMVC